MRKVEIAAKVFVGTFLIFLLICPASIALANAGPPMSLEDGDVSFLIPVKHDSIEIISESLIYDISMKEELSTANITAIYEMRNTANNDVTTLLAFVANNPELGVSAWLDDLPIQALRRDIFPWNISGEGVYKGDLLARAWSNIGLWTSFGPWEPTFEEILRFARDGERTSDANSGYDLEMSLFELDFPADSTRTLKVEYTENGAIIKERKGYSYKNPTVEFYYFLEPASYWKDFSNLTISINAPMNVDVETSLPGFEQTPGEQQLVANFEKLPIENLRILVTPKPSLLNDVIVPATPWVLLTILTAAGVLVAIRFRRRART